MSNINVSASVIVDLVKWGIEAGADALKARQVLQAAGVDQAIYERVIADTRTFKDFHGVNPLDPRQYEPPPPQDPTLVEYDTIAQAIAATTPTNPNVILLANGKFIVYSTIGPFPGEKVYPVPA